MEVHKTGLKRSVFKDIYHSVIAASWFEFFVVNTTLYLGLNVFFAFLYMVGGENIVNAEPGSFWDAFVFSFQTSTTIGYGHMLPANSYTDAVVVIDTLSGIIFVAITTGLAFAKFSKPTAHILFTDRCVIHQYEGKKTLFFRVANARDAHIADASIEASVVMREESQEGVAMQRIHDIQLVRSKTPIFVLSWSVMHVIDEASPLMQLTWEDLVEKNVRIVVSLSGIDDWTGQLVHACHIYKYDEIVYNQRFADILTDNSDGSVTMDYSQFNELVEFSEKPT
jgi:inward rectifier potassium channel